MAQDRGLQGFSEPHFLLQLAADHLEEELNLLLNLDAPVKEGGDVLSDQTAQGPGIREEWAGGPEAAGMVFILFHPLLLILVVFLRIASPSSHPIFARCLPSIWPHSLTYFCAHISASP